MSHVVSRDGTHIAFERIGTGPVVILAGGSLVDHHFYTPLAKELAEHFTVYNFDRRGRGQSSDTKPYTVEREIEDLSALIADANGSVYLYGHSAGAALGLRAAAAGLDIAKLVLADPPYSPHDENAESASAAFAEEAAHVQELHDKGDHRAAAAFFLGGFGLPPEDVEGMLQSPAGEGMIECARALPYDFAMLGDGLVPTALAGTVTVPTMILAPEPESTTARALAGAIPNGQYEPMEASAHELAPADIAHKLIGFFGQS